jgi:hypothetical protein
MKRTLLATTMLLSLATASFAQQPKPITLNDVPPHVMATALALANAIKFEKVQLDYDDGTAKYEFVGKLPNGKAFEVDVYTDGRVEEVEEEIDMNSVPPAVRATLNRFFPNLQPAKVEKSTRANLGVWYEFDAKDPRAGEIDIEISADGKRILIQDDDAG